MNHFWELFDWSKFIAGMGMLLFGLDLLEDSVSHIGETAQNFIKKYTKGTLSSIIVGIFTTAVLQSSSIVSLIIIAFVGSGIIGLTEGVGMMIGANIGTTFLDNVLAFLSFETKFFDIKHFIFPIMGFSGLLGFFVKSKRKMFYGIFGLTIIFLGIDFMKSTMSILNQVIDLNAISHYNMIVFVLFGIFVSAAIRSSSSVILMSITSLNAGIINLPIGFAIMIGANIGTCITAIQGSIGKTQITKRIAYSHLFFNVFTALIFGVFFYYSIDIFTSLNLFLSSILHYNPSQEKVLMLFIGGFDIIGAILIYPFIGYFVKFLAYIFPDEKGQNIPLLYIDKIDSLTGKFAIEALTKDVRGFYESCKQYNIDQINIYHGQDNTEKFKKYNYLKNIYDRIIKYVSNLDGIKLPNGSNTVKLQNIMNSSFYSVKYLEDIDHNIYKLYSSDNKVCKEYFEYFVNKTKILYDTLQDAKNSENKKAIHDLLSDIKIDDQYFVDKFINHDNDLDSINGISDIITIHKYYYISCEDIVDADHILSNL